MSGTSPYQNVFSSGSSYAVGESAEDPLRDQQFFEKTDTEVIFLYSSSQVSFSRDSLGKNIDLVCDTWPVNSGSFTLVRPAITIPDPQTCIGSTVSFFVTGNNRASVDFTTQSGSATAFKLLDNHANFHLLTKFVNGTLHMDEVPAVLSGVSVAGFALRKQITLESYGTFWLVIGNGLHPLRAKDTSDP